MFPEEEEGSVREQVHQLFEYDLDKSYTLEEDGGTIADSHGFRCLSPPAFGKTDVGIGRHQ